MVTNKFIQIVPKKPMQITPLNYYPSFLKVGTTKYFLIIARHLNSVGAIMLKLVDIGF